MPLSPDDLAVDFFPQVGFATPEARATAWGAYRAAAMALATRAKEDEDQIKLAHPIWSHEDAGWLAETRGPLGQVIAWLDFGGGSLWIERRDPQEGTWIELDGRSVQETADWARAASARLAGLVGMIDGTAPDHTGDGRAFDLDDADARSDLEALYEGAGLLLSVLSAVLERAGHSPSQPQLDPNTLTASISISGTAKISVELNAPDAASPSGCWTVAVEPGTEAATDPSTTPLDGCEWLKKGEAHVAMLPIEGLTALVSGEAQHARIAAFLTSALNASLESSRD